MSLFLFSFSAVKKLVEDEICLVGNTYVRAWKVNTNACRHTGRKYHLSYLHLFSCGIIFKWILE